ncbi:hypothetical protein [Nakamurella leprariae]|nr:hypothetical protein [Nakamurella leprariae]
MRAAVDTAPLVTETSELASVQEAFETQLAADDVMTVVVTMEEAP